ncbi:MAG: hypothetical protein AAF825_08190 [Pseudomonadota bacterium]
MEPSALLDLLRFTHLSAMAVGLGCAFLCDFALLTRLHRGLSPELAALLHLAHPVIWGALGVMWASGLALAAWRTGLEIGQVSPKLIAKFVVVSLLTANAVVIGRHALPRLEARGAMGLRGLSDLEHRAASVLAGISAASWLLALALGSSRLLAAAPAPVFWILLPVAYACAIATAHWVIAGLRSPARRVVATASQNPNGARSYRLRDTRWSRRRAA